MKKLYWLLSVVMIFALVVPAMSAENVDMPNIPVVIPLAAASIELAKFCVSPVSHVVDQAINEYRGYPLSLVSEAGNAVINIGLDLYQAVNPMEWALNRDLYAPVKASVYNGGKILAVELE